jgi:hypothetical protein
MIASRDLRWVQGLIAAVAVLTHPTLGSPFPPSPPICNRLPMTRPFPRRRWRDAVFEGPFGRSPGRSKFAEPSSERVLRFTIA